MNLGIVLAVSDYGSSENNLPGCEADGKAISAILKSDTKFDDVLVLSSKTQSAEVKNQLIEFINTHKNSDINEVVFYYTGHGDFSGKEFYFLLSDYDSNRRKQTSLENTELDNLLKALNSNVTIKIVDACHSGKPYIKDSDAFDKYLNESKGQFDKCYFMYSSQLEQYSYQDDSLSFFTKSIIDAVKDHSAKTIRYKDIIDYVSDSFESNSEQTPFFVVQADFTEPFCSISSSLVSELNSLSNLMSDVNTKDDSEQSSLLEKIRTDSERYCTQDEAYSVLNSILENFKSASFIGEISDLYNCECTSGDLLVKNAVAIGNWLAKSEQGYFAKPLYKEVEKSKRELKNSGILGGLSSIALTKAMYSDKSDDKVYKTVKYTESVISGYDITIDQPVKLIELTATPKFSNISAGHVFIVPFLSKTEVRIFYSYSHYSDSGWEEKILTQKPKWLTKSFPLKGSNVSEFVNLLIKGFGEFLIEPLNKQFEMLSSEQEPEKEPVAETEAQ